MRRRKANCHIQRCPKSTCMRRTRRLSTKSSMGISRSTRTVERCPRGRTGIDKMTLFRPKSLEDRQSRALKSVATPRPRGDRVYGQILTRTSLVIHSRGMEYSVVHALKAACLFVKVHTKLECKGSRYRRSLDAPRPRLVSGSSRCQMPYSSQSTTHHLPPWLNNTLEYTHSFLSLSLSSFMTVFAFFLVFP